MNNTFKKQIREVVSSLENASSTLEEIRDEEQDRYDNMSDSAQESERGGSCMEGIDALDEAIYNIEDVVGTLSDLV